MLYEKLGAPRVPGVNFVFYYLHDFQTALHWIVDRYADLLSPEERTFIEQFERLPRASQALLVRLIMRKGVYFRASRLSYPEIGDIDSAVGPLIALDWIDPQPVLGVRELFKLFTRAELALIFGELRAAIPKADALQSLQSIHGAARSLAEWHLDSNERVYLVKVAPLCTCFRLLFFGDFDQEWSQFVLADLGIFKYETVDFSRDSRAFQRREDIEAFFALYECRCLFQDRQPLEEVLARLPRAVLDHEWLEARRAKLLFRIAREHERRGEYQRALGLYAESSYPGARVRAIRAMEASAQYRDAHQLASRAAENPESDAERQILTRVLDRLDRHLVRKRGTPLHRTTAGRLDLFLTAAERSQSVERVAAGQLAEAESPVYYVESTLINSLFGLLCWEAIFAPVCGAFFHPFHAGPVDLYSREFRRRRERPFERCLMRLENDSYRDYIHDNFCRKQGLQSPFVHWRTLTAPLLDLALRCIPAAHLEGYFERLLSNIRDNRSGLPDLIQFWPAERRYRLIEVKGPGDRLQDNQKRWIDYCVALKIPIAVCHVRWA
jgi:VRR-NUC domain/Fanconi anemia-associated nuclease SAP domain